MREVKRCGAVILCSTAADASLLNLRPLCPLLSPRLSRWPLDARSASASAKQRAAGAREGARRGPHTSTCGAQALSLYTHHLCSSVCFRRAAQREGNDRRRQRGAQRGPVSRSPAAELERRLCARQGTPRRGAQQPTPVSEAALALARRTVRANSSLSVFPLSLSLSSLSLSLSCTRAHVCRRRRNAHAATRGRAFHARFAEQPANYEKDKQFLAKKRAQERARLRKTDELPPSPHAASVVASSAAAVHRSVPVPTPSKLSGSASMSAARTILEELSVRSLLTNTTAAGYVAFTTHAKHTVRSAVHNISALDERWRGISLFSPLCIFRARVQSFRDSPHDSPARILPRWDTCKKVRADSQTLATLTGATTSTTPSRSPPPRRLDLPPPPQGRRRCVRPLRATPAPPSSTATTPRSRKRSFAPRSEVRSPTAGGGIQVNTHTRTCAPCNVAAETHLFVPPMCAAVAAGLGAELVPLYECSSGAHGAHNGAMMEMAFQTVALTEWKLALGTQILNRACGNGAPKNVDGGTGCVVLAVLPEAQALVECNELIVLRTAPLYLARRRVHTSCICSGGVCTCAD